MSVFDTDLSSNAAAIAEIIEGSAEPNDDTQAALNASELVPAPTPAVPTKNFYDYTLPELGDILTSMGQQKFRGQQVFKWVYEKRVENYDEM